jgi:5-carboxymethyl-2-hydroxymuconate isomerase
LIVEYSANIEAEIAVDDLLDKLHSTALSTGIFPLGGVRVRAVRIEKYRIGDCHPDNGFVNMMALVGHGRTVDVRRRAGEQLFATLTAHLDGVYRARPLAISFYMHESHPDLSFKKNNLHERAGNKGS